MFSIGVLVRNKGEREWSGLGTREFVALPRLGERIEMNVDPSTGRVVALTCSPKVHSL